MHSIRTALIALALLGACGRSTEPRSPQGTYTLATVNGAALPALDANADTIRAGTAALNADGTYHIDLQARSGGASGAFGAFDILDDGTWSATGSVVQLVQAGTGALWANTYTGATLTIHMNGDVLGFSR